MEQTSSRIKNTTINSTVAIISKILTFLLQFICRTVFIKVLSTEYLGVNGLFTNILTILSFAELGIGNAIIFKLYKPIAEDNKEKVKTYMKFYQKAYILIGIVILIIGIMIIPFLKYMVNDVPDIKENIYFIYVLFLANSIISYFFTYKKSIIIGYQKEYVTTIINLIVIVIQNIVQIGILITTKNYILYLLIQIIATFLDNFIASKKADKMYPFIKENKYKKISKIEEKNIFTDVKSLILYKIGYILSNGTDNIIISAFVGVSEVGLLSNYTTITTAITTFLSSFFNSFTASVGNLNAGDDKEKKESIFYQILLLSFLIYGFVSIAIILLSNDFISIWLGNDYILDLSICLALGFNMYVDGMRFVNYTFRNTMGLFKKGRFIPLISSISNIVLSVILVQYIGIFGVLIATGLTRLFITTMYDPYLLHKYKFNTSSKRYYLTYLYYLTIAIIDFFVCKIVLSKILVGGILGFIIKGILIMIITYIVFLIFVFKMKEFKELKNILNNLVINRLMRRKEA